MPTPTQSPVKPQSKVSICFLSPLESATDQKAIQAAYRDIGSQILKFAEAIKIDKNIIISHSVVSDDPKDMKPVTRITADAKMAELQTINKKVEKGVSAVDKPKDQPVTEIPSGDDEFDPPRVQAVTDWKPTIPTAVTPAVSSAPVSTSSVADVEAMKAVLLTKFDRVTAKSKALVSYFVENRDKEVSVDEIATGSGVDKAGVNVWLGSSAKAIKAIENVKRGVYKLDSAKVKIKAK